MTHFCLDVLERRWAYEREADEENVRLRVRQRPETVVVFLSSRVPQAERDGLAVHHHIRGVVIEHCKITSVLTVEEADTSHARRSTPARRGNRTCRDIFALRDAVRQQVSAPNR